ncbi:MAG: aminotransferase class V-fold PLP-dependent enzyme, partial [Actinomycetales bacterium]
EFGSSGKRSESDLEQAITAKTLAIFWIAGTYVGDDALSIETTVRIAKKHSIPVIVDAAAQLPPVSNLSFFTVKAGADLVLFSGGKSLCGPQSTGLMLGSSRIIEAAAKLAAPNQGIARAFKVGKEEIFGITQAIENYLERDHEKDLKKWQKNCAKISEKLSKISGLNGEIHQFNQAGQPIPRVEIKFNTKFPSDTADRVYENLLTQDPAIVLDQDGPLFISPDMLKNGEVKLVIAALERALSEVTSLRKEF